MGILALILVGAIAGWIASAIMKTGTGIFIDMVLGIIGAWLGSWIMSAFGETGVTGFNFYSIIVAIIGAIVLIAIVRLLRGRPVR